MRKRAERKNGRKRKSGNSKSRKERTGSDWYFRRRSC
jgi:hypothetical protein